MTGVTIRADSARQRLRRTCLAQRRSLHLDAIRDAGLRAARLAEALFHNADADLVAVQDGRLWRAKPPNAACDEAIARWLALSDGDTTWIADTRSAANPHRANPPKVRPDSPVRFFAAAPVRLRSGERVGALRVFGFAPRPFDEALAARLRDLAAIVADEWERLGSEVRRVWALFEQAPGFMTVVSGSEHRYELVNAAYEAFIGHRNVLGRAAREAVPDLAAQGFIDICDRVYRTGVPYLGHGARVLVQRDADAPPVETYADFVFQPLCGTDGTVWGIFCQGQDVTHEKLAVGKLEQSRVRLEAMSRAMASIFAESHDAIRIFDRPDAIDQLRGDADGTRGALAQQKRLAAHLEESSSYRRMFASLSPRQGDVLEGVLAGKLNKIIAHELGLSVRTVEGYRAEIMARTQAKSLPELVRMSVLAGL